MTTPIKLQNYVGASLLNARQLNLSLRLMTGDAKPPQLSYGDVMALLNVIESLAMSSQVLYDNSIQPADRELLAHHNRLYRNLLTPTSLVTDDEWLACCANATAQSALMLQKWLATPELWADEQPVNAAQAQQFCNALEAGFANPDPEYARHLLKTLPFLGAKSVAGILLTCDEAAKADYRQAIATARTQEADTLGKLVAGIVNRFRVNYVNELAAGHDAAYVAAPNIEGLKAQQTLLLWRYLGQQQLTTNPTRLSALKQQSDDESASLQSFPYAYALLMNRKVKTPSQLLDLLFKVRDENLIAQQAREHASGKRFIHDWSDDEFIQTQQTLFAHTYLDLTNYKQSLRERLLTVSRACLPAMLSAGSAGIGLVIPDSGAESLLAAGMATSGVMLQSKNMNTSGQAKAKLYRDNYMLWNKLLDHATARNNRGVSLFGQIEQVFGTSVEVRDAASG